MGRPCRLAVSTLGLLLVSGCAVGPNFHKPAAPEVTGYTPETLPPRTAEAPIRGGGAQTFVQGMDIPGQWWTLFHSPALNALVDHALAANADLAAAKAALRVAKETLYAQRGAFLPSLDADYNIVREKASETPAPPLANNNNLFTLQTAQLTVSYTPDVFGGVRRQTETVAAQAEAQKFETQAAYLTLTSNLVSTAIQEASVREQIDATRKIVAADREILTILQRQKAAGQVMGLDVAAQEAALAQAEQSLPPLEKQQAQLRDLLAALTGRLPSEPGVETLDLASISLPTDLPVSLPSRLVEQRPDIRAAEANLHAASAQVGVAIANRLPNFTLSANAGGAATSIADLFTNGNTFWTLTGDVTQPIFHGGTLLHRQKAAEAALDQARAQYRSTVIGAFQNVADTLQALQADGQAIETAARSEQAAGSSLAITRRQLDLGQVSAAALLIAEQTYQQAVISRLQAELARYTDTVALFQALGGGWWNRKET
jgi:NodT family efflux transporter outer membrane factor (OMF) lipoprotein